MGNLGGALGPPTISIFQLPDRPPRFSVRDLLWDRFLMNFVSDLRLIGPKAHWINVEGVHAQRLVSNTPYTVLKDFGVQRSILVPFCGQSGINFGINVVLILIIFSILDYFGMILGSILGSFWGRSGNSKIEVLGGPRAPSKKFRTPKK